jgi:putative nucleotidyltransferase with HDIG domain
LRTAGREPKGKWPIKTRSEYIKDNGGLGAGERKLEDERKNCHIDFVDQVLDSVHGFIGLTPVERKLIDLPVFSRLQSIKQLSAVNWIFPGAEHTRYTHSLGVMHIADKMAQKLEFCDADRQIIRLAALLHDIGHYPFSHVGEEVYKENDIPLGNGVVEYQKKRVKERVDSLTAKSKWLHNFVREVYPYHHESIGAKVILHHEEIAKIINKLCPFVFYDDLRAMIIGDYKRLDIADKIQILHSELDADRIDYILRDSAFSGTNYGNLDLGVVINNLCFSSDHGLGDIEVFDYPGLRVMGIRRKGIAAADQFLLNRFLSSTQIIANRHVAAIEFMLKTIMKAFSEQEDDIFPKISHFFEQYIYSQKTQREFLRFTDAAFWNALFRVTREESAQTKYKDDHHILGMMKLIEKHQEIKGVRKSVGVKDGKVRIVIDECAVLSDNYEYIKQTIQKSEIYKRINHSKKTIPYLYEISLTNHLKQKHFDDAIENWRDVLGKQGTNSEFLIDGNDENTLRIRRLLDGLAVIEDDGTPTMLIDNETSLLHTLAGQKYVVLRGYDVTGSEQDLKDDEILGITG